MLLPRCGERGNIRENDFGIWQAYSWRDHLAQSKLIAPGLAATAFQRGDKRTIIGSSKRKLPADFSAGASTR